MLQALEAFKEGIVDHLGGLDETLQYIDEMQLTKKVGPGMSGINAYGPLKREMWKETVALLENHGSETAIDEKIDRQLEVAGKAREKKVAAWEGNKAKL